MKLVLKQKSAILFFYIFFFFLFSFTIRRNDPDLFEMTLQDFTGESFSFNNIKNNSASIFVFFLPDCPLAQNYTLTVKHLTETFKKETPKVYYVIPGKDYSRKEIKEFTQDYQIEESKVLLDPDYEFATYVGASISPESFLIDKKGEVQYQGAIDNWAYELGKKRKVITEKYLEDALNAYYSNGTILKKKTKSIGCFLNMPNHKHHHSKEKKNDSKPHHHN